MSIYTEVSAALRNLVADGEDFTEEDIIEAARHDHPEWSEGELREAYKHANGAIGAEWRAKKVVRFGPVHPPEGKPDYLRRRGRIVYAPNMDVLHSIQTPNGSFPPIVHDNDPLYNPKGGRPPSTDRDDFISWIEAPEEDVTALRAEIRLLRDENVRLQRLLRQHQQKQSPSLVDFPPEIIDELARLVALRLRLTEPPAV